MQRPQLHVHKGDTVEVTSGVHKGASGRVLEVFRTKNRALVEGVRMIKKHVRKSQDHPQGTISQREGPIHVSNLRVIEAGERKNAGAKAKAAGKKE